MSMSKLLIALSLYLDLVSSSLSTRYLSFRRPIFTAIGKAFGVGAVRPVGHDSWITDQRNDVAPEKAEEAVEF